MPPAEGFASASGGGAGEGLGDGDGDGDGAGDGGGEKPRLSLHTPLTSEVLFTSTIETSLSSLTKATRGSLITAARSASEKRAAKPLKALR